MVNFIHDKIYRENDAEPSWAKKLRGESCLDVMQRMFSVAAFRRWVPPIIHQSVDQKKIVLKTIWFFWCLIMFYELFLVFYGRIPNALISLTTWKQVLLACVSPARSNFDESVSTLEFAVWPWGLMIWRSWKVKMTTILCWYLYIFMTCLYHFSREPLSEGFFYIIVEVCHHIFTSSHLHIFTSSHLHIFSSSHLALLPSRLLALLPSCPLAFFSLLLFPQTVWPHWRGSYSEG